jgi:hypothetical protein
MREVYATMPAIDFAMQSFQHDGDNQTKIILASSLISTTHPACITQQT